MMPQIQWTKDPSPKGHSPIRRRLHRHTLRGFVLVGRWLVFTALFLMCSQLLLAQDSYEEDDVCRPDLGLIAGGDTQVRDFEDDNEDWLRFFACQGRTYTFTTSSLGADVDTLIGVYERACGSGLAADDNGGGGLASSLTWTAPQSGFYFLRVSNLLAGGSKTSRYALTLTGDTSPCAYFSRAMDLGSGGEWIWDLTPSLDGSMLFAGAANYVSGSGQDGWLEKRDPQGQRVWARRCVLSPHSRFTRVVENTNGDIFVVGLTNSAPVAPTRFFLWVVKFDSGGNRQWEASLGSTDGGTASGVDLAATDDGGVIVLGDQWDWASGEGRLLLAKLSGAGVIERTAHLGQTGESYSAVALSPSTDGHWFVLAQRNTGPGGALWVAKLQTDFTMLWSMNFPVGSGVLRGSDLHPMAGGGVMVSGFHENPDKLAVLLQLSDTGAPTAQALYSQTNTELAGPRLTAAPDGGWYLNGSNDDTLPQRAWLMKVNAALAPLWLRTYHPTSADHGYLYDVERHENGSLWAAGKTYPSGGSSSDTAGWLLSTDDLGLMGSGCGTPLAQTGSQQLSSLSLTGTAGFGSTMVMSLMDIYPVSTVINETAADTQHCQDLRIVPGEVSGNGSSEPLLLPDTSTFSWDDGAGSGAATFNLYRGDLADLALGRFGSCDASGLTSGDWTDPAVPSSGEAWFYLVSGVNSYGEGSLGDSSSGTPRPNTTPCP